MNNPDQGNVKLATQEDQYSVAPGSRLEIPLAVINEGSIPEQVRISVEGIPLVWVSTEQPVVLVQPGEHRQVVLIVHPPAPPNARSGRYRLNLLASSSTDPALTSQVSVSLTVAGFEVKGRVGVLLDSLLYGVVPGEQLTIPVVLINQGLGIDTFQLSIDALPQGWSDISVSSVQLEPGEVKEAVITLRPPRDPGSRAGRYSFHILVESQEAPDQSVSIDCSLTVAAFIEFTSSLEAAQPDRNLPANVSILNLSNVPAVFRVAWGSPEKVLTFEPGETQQVSLKEGETAKLDYTPRLARRPFAGGEKNYPYIVTVQASDQQTRTMEGVLIARGLLPVWALITGGAAILLLCLVLVWSIWQPRISEGPATTETPVITSTALLPTATQSQVDQLPLLVGRTWNLVAFNDTRSIPGVQEPFTLFNPDGTLIGYTGCKDLSARYQTNLNQISIINLSLGSGACPDAALQQQEDAMVAILRSARSYFVADTALQVAGDAGFLNYSLTPVNRPEETQPPQAVIRAVTQSVVGQVVVFDGSASTGQAPIISWKWDFGDGAAASGQVVQHVYRNAGNYSVRLTVTDQLGQPGSSTQQIYILAQPTPTLQSTQPPTLPAPTTPPEQPTATPEPPVQPAPPQANAAGPSQGFIGEPVIFDASASQPGSSSIVSYNWVFGNGEVSPLSPDPMVSTIYNSAGEYEVTVFVVDANGLNSFDTTRIRIDARLDAAVWTLASINGQPLLPGTAITAQFLQGQLAGFAGCNSYDGNYTAIDNGDGSYSVTIERITTSRKTCPADIMNQENEFLAILQQAATAVIQENMAILQSPIGELVFYLIESP
jgi:heat shock protein HslJ